MNDDVMCSTIEMLVNQFSPSLIHNCCRLGNVSIRYNVWIAITWWLYMIQL